MAETKIIVLDDGPTGSQTEHACLLLTHWDQNTLRAVTVMRDVCRQPQADPGQPSRARAALRSNFRQPSRLHAA